MGIVETTVGLAGAVASLVGLALYIWHRKRQAPKISQNGSSIVHGDKNIVDIRTASATKAGSQPEDCGVAQLNSSYVVGSGNRVEIHVPEPEEAHYETSIIITRHYRPCVEFSLVSTGGLTEVLQLYIELIQIYECRPGVAMIEARSFKCNYLIHLVPTVRIYPLIPPTMNEWQDTWVLKGPDVDLFSVEFEWPQMTAAEIVIKAQLVDHATKEEKLLCSETISLQRNGESRSEISRPPLDNRFSFSPWLYKLMTVKGFLRDSRQARFSEAHVSACAEIAAQFNMPPDAFAVAITKQERSQLIFDSQLHPSLANLLIDIWDEIHPNAVDSPSVGS